MKSGKGSTGIRNAGTEYAGTGYREEARVRERQRKVGG